ncbi:MAG: hypothetical protein MI924_20445 [Chloroflexales bacterium]|nr:hypothetical protein [Chloroflexales bacterium]
MLFRTLLRLSPAVWLSPLLICLGVLFAIDLGPAVLDPYPLQVTAVGAAALFMVAPLCAACAAWEAGRWRRAGWLTLPHVRAPLARAVTVLAPTLLVGVIVCGLALGVMMGRAGIVLLPDLRVLAMACVGLLAYTLLGFAIGVHVPPVIATPTIFLGILLWMGLPRTTEPGWLRHLTGVWPLCCRINADLAPQALVGAMLVACGVLAAAVALLLTPGRIVRWLGAAAPLLAGLAVGSVLVRDLGVYPDVGRDPALLVCSQTQPRVCVWPEQQPRLDEVTALLTGAAQRWRDLGVAVPDTVGEAPYQDSSAVRSFGFSMTASPAIILNALAYSLLPPFPSCGGDAPYLGFEAESWVLAWLVLQAGATPEQVAGMYPPETLPIVAQVRAGSAAQQAAWYAHNRHALGACGVAPQAALQP